MTLQIAIENTIEFLAGKQDPDQVTYTKQWDERGALKGWVVECKWTNTQVTYDMTDHYMREIGDIDSAPNYTPGTHV